MFGEQFIQPFQSQGPVLGVTNMEQIQYLDGAISEKGEQLIIYPEGTCQISNVHGGSWLRSDQRDLRFTDIFKCVFLNE